MNSLACPPLEPFLEDVTTLFDAPTWLVQGCPPQVAACHKVASPKPPRWAIPQDSTSDGEPVVVTGPGRAFAVGLPVPLPGAPHLVVLFDERTSPSSGRTGMAWNQESAAQAARLALRHWRRQAQVAVLERDVDCVAEEINRTYEEMAFLHDVARNLRLAHDPFELARASLERLLECLPVQHVILATRDPGLPDRRAPFLEGRPASHAGWYVLCQPHETDGVLVDRLLAWVAQDAAIAHDQVRVFNRESTIRSGAELPEGVTSLIVARIEDDARTSGWLLAVDHMDGAELGSVEASLVTSVASILGVHFGNCRLYREQASLLESIVRSLVTSIEAKDPYTRGHSVRVAHISVLLAEAMDLPAGVRNTLYMSALLHDIGKIGVEDAVLRKPGKLTDEEFEQIKKHPEIGARILKDIRAFEEIVPGVLYHHEEWDGSGYPHGLAGIEIPLIARVIAVADAYDAMTSDRPYRSGMARERVDAILKSGRGIQWAPDVIDAYFRVADAIEASVRHQRAELTDSVCHWSAQAVGAR